MLSATIVLLGVTQVALRASATTTTLEPTSRSGSESCDPVWTAPGGTHQCVAEASGWPGQIGATASVQSIDAPSAYVVTARAASTNSLSDTIGQPTTSITYTWNFRVQGRDHGTGVSASATRGRAIGYVALRVIARHASCTACTATVRRVLVGSDPATGQSGPDEILGLTAVTAAVTLTNPDGGPVPAGTIDVSAEVEALSSWALDSEGLFQGRSEAGSGLAVVSVTAVDDRPPSTTSSSSSTSTSSTTSTTAPGDHTRPTITMLVPDINAGHVPVTGAAVDNVGVTAVVVRYYLPQTTVLVAARDASCAGCPGASIGWSQDEGQLPPGSYTVQAFARDAVGNWGSTPPATIILV